MKNDKIKLYLITATLPIVVALSFFLPNDLYKNLYIAVICALYYLLTVIFVKKKKAPLKERRQILIITLAWAVGLIALRFLSGIKFGFYANPFARVYIWKYILPFSATIIFSENIRRAVVCAENKTVGAIAYISLTFVEVALFYKNGALKSFSGAADLAGMIIFPAIASNLLYTFLTARYGALPSILYRILLALYPYLLTVMPATTDILLSAVKIMAPLVLAAFLRALFCKGEVRLYATSKFKSSKIIARASLCLAGIFAVGYLMLSSCAFGYGLIVIATPSMTGAINVGDGVIYRSYSGEVIEEGDIIVFKRDKMSIVHRVVSVEYDGSSLRYYTKGDANEANDASFVTSSDIEGKVLLRVKYIGMPTVLLRELFK